MKELLEKLEKSMKEMKDIIEVTEKYPKYVDEKLLQKRLDDGMVNNLGNASLYQLKRLGESGQFRYYDKAYSHKKIDMEIQRKTRELKLERLLK